VTQFTAARRWSFQSSVLAESEAKVRGDCPERGSHARTVPSAPPEYSHRPVWSKPTAVTLPMCPSRVATGPSSGLRATSKILITGLHAAAMKRLSGVTARALTWDSFTLNVFTGSPVVGSQMRIVWS
jgi:hypothetical protein